MIKIHRNLYNAQEKGKEVKIEKHEVKSEKTDLIPTNSIAQESEAPKPVKAKKKKKAKKEEV